MDQVHGITFQPHDLGTLVKAFSLLIEDRKLSNLAHSVASFGKLLSKSMLASDCIADYAKLLENLLQFPSDVILPLSISHIKQDTWAWDLLEKEIVQTSTSAQHNQYHRTMRRHSIVDFLEEQATGKLQVQTTTEVANESSAEDFPTKLDWDILAEMEILEESDRREREEVSFFFLL